MNACCIYSVKPTWRHGTASALTSLISILPRGEGRSHRAESVLQNCVMGRCAICIFMYCYISLFTMKSFLGTIWKNLEDWRCLLPYIRPELRELTQWQCVGGFCYTVLAKNFEKITQITIIYTKVCSTRSCNGWNVVRRRNYGLTSAYVDVSRNGTYILQILTRYWQIYIIDGSVSFVSIKSNV